MEKTATLFPEIGEAPAAPARRTRAEIHADYEGFVEKFKPKFTTDDCYTPPEIYEAVLEWVDANIQPLAGLRVRRPFKPGGDYQAEAEGYGPDDVVIDNPPFSILSQIRRHYHDRGIRYFLFSPFNSGGTPLEGETVIVAAGRVTYENGADVRTSFVTNMEGKHAIMTAGDLSLTLNAISRRLAKKDKKKLRRLSYPPEVVTPALLDKIAERGITFKVPMDEACHVRKLDNSGSLFGSGFLLSERMAAERMAAQEAIKVELSEREREIVRGLSRLRKEENT